MRFCQQRHLARLLGLLVQGKSDCDAIENFRGDAFYKRRGIKTMMQASIYRAGRLIEYGSRLILGLGTNNRVAKLFARLHGELFAATHSAAGRKPAPHATSNTRSARVAA